MYIFQGHGLQISGKKGFTVIELIVVVAIMLVLLGYTLANYSSYNRNQKVRQAALTFQSNLQKAKTDAATGKKPVSCDSSQRFDGYRISFPTNNSYVITSRCTGEDITSETFSLPAGIAFSPWPDPAFFDYYPLTGGISDAPATITVTDGVHAEIVVIDDTTIPTISATQTPTSTLTPTATATSTPTASPSPTPANCNQHCMQKFGWSGSCINAAICDGISLPHSNEGSIYDCSSTKVCCCTQ